MTSVCTIRHSRALCLGASDLEREDFCWRCGGAGGGGWGARARNQGHAKLWKVDVFFLRLAPLSGGSREGS